MSSPKRRRPLSYLTLLGYIALIGLIAGAVGAFASDLPAPVGEIAWLVIGAALMAVVFAGTLVWWRGADEAVHEAHKWAWWWGGSAGIAAGAVLLLWIGRFPNRPSSLAWTGDPFTAGIVTILLLQMLGYGVAWATWWLRRR